MIRLKIIQLASAILLLTQLVNAPLASGQTSTPPGTFTAKNANNVWFWEYLPHGFNPADGNKKYPLLVFLHGIGQTANSSPQSPGTLAEVKNEGIPYEIAQGANMCFSVNGQEQCFIVLAPQMPYNAGTNWVNITEDIFEYASATYGNKIDKQMIYLTGLSMGGLGTIDYIYSNRFWSDSIAATAVAPGGLAPDGSAVCSIITDNIDFWAVQGRGDTTPQTLWSDMEDFVNDLNACTPAPRPKVLMYDIPGVGHNVWDDFYYTGASSHVPKIRYEPNVYEWFLMNRKDGPNISPNQKPFLGLGSGFADNMLITGTSLNVKGRAMDYDGSIDTTTIAWSKVSQDGSILNVSGIVKNTGSDYVERTAIITNMTTDGVYTFRLTANDGYGGAATFKDYTITKGPNNPPVVSLTGPARGSIFLAGTDITITATASDPQADGRVSKVEFYDGGNKIGEDTSSPFSITWTNAPVGNHSITARATDNLGATTVSSARDIAVVNAGTCSAPGYIVREQWNDMSGTSIPAIPTTAPSSTSELRTNFETSLSPDDNYFARMRGYVCAPATGNYVFAISSDDRSELWLSTNMDPANKTLVAFVSSAVTTQRKWDQHEGNQQSDPVYLVAGQSYYIEALHKQGSGNDHLAVGWKLPDQTVINVIPSGNLSPFSTISVSISSPQNGATYNTPANIVINASATTTSGTIAKVEFYQGVNKLGEDASSPYSYAWQGAVPGNYSLTAKAIDNAGIAMTSSPVSVTVINPNGCNASGTITYEAWYGIAGTSLTVIPAGTPPDSTYELTSFDARRNRGSQFQARIRGYICIPVSGAYTFVIASDDKSELWLSSSESPANISLIASVTGYTNPLVWTKYPSQTSAPQNLLAGQRYYIEARHKEDAGVDHIEVGWIMPGNTTLPTEPISGSYLSPYVSASAPTATITNPTNGQTFTANDNIAISASASDTDGTISKVEFFYGGSNKIGEATTSPYTITWTNVATGTYTLTARATDNSGASTTSAGVDITVTGGILREQWDGIAGIDIVPTPTTTPIESQPTSFAGPIDIGTNYQARYRGYIHPPVTGDYIFWIASDDKSKLYLSTSDNPDLKEEIASVNAYTNSLQWTRYPSQQSVAKNLVAGQRYYIEAVHKEASGRDHLAVRWQKPDGSTDGPIPGTYLSPYIPDPSPSAAPAPDPARMDVSAFTSEQSFQIYPNPVNNVMYIKGIRSANVKIYNPHGYMISDSREVSNEGTISIRTDNLKPGIYYLLLQGDKQLHRHRFVKE